MADVNRGNRPLSPYMLGQYYRLQLNSAMSLLHRLTGIALTLAAILVVCWFLAAGATPESFARVDGFLTSWFGGLILILSLAAFWYHVFNGIRHLVWDTGRWFSIEMILKSGYGVLIAAGVMTVITLIAAF